MLACKSIYVKSLCSNISENKCWIFFLTVQCFDCTYYTYMEYSKYEIINYILTLHFLQCCSVVPYIHECNLQMPFIFQTNNLKPKNFKRPTNKVRYLTLNWMCLSNNFCWTAEVTSLSFVIGQILPGPSTSTIVCSILQRRHLAFVSRKH